MPRHIEFRNHPDAALARILDQLAHLRLRIKLPIRSQLGQFREFLALQPESLIVRQMQVQHVQLHRLHRVHISFQRVHVNKMPAHVDHQPAPGKSWRVFDMHRRSPKARRCDLNQLQKSLQAMQNSQRIRRAQLCSRSADFQYVAFVLSQFLHRFARVLRVNHQRRFFRRNAIHPHK